MLVTGVSHHLDVLVLNVSPVISMMENGSASARPAQVLEWLTGIQGSSGVTDNEEMIQSPSPSIQHQNQPTILLLVKQTCVFNSLRHNVAKWE